MKNFLVMGGARYVGSYMCKYLAKHDYHPTVLDDLSRGHREAVRWGPLIQGPMADMELLKHIFSEYRKSS